MRLLLAKGMCTFTNVIVLTLVTKMIILFTSNIDACGSL